MCGVNRRKMKLLGLKKGSSLKRGNASKTIGILSDHGLWQILIGSGIHDDLDRPSRIENGGDALDFSRFQNYESARRLIQSYTPKSLK